MDNFLSMTREWASFFETLAQISGSLVGLVFVALTFNPRLLGDAEDPILGTLAAQTFADFVLLLLVSLAMLTPHMSPENVGALIMTFAIGDVLRVARRLWRGRAYFARRSNRAVLTQRFFLSFSGHALLAWSGLELFRGDTDSSMTQSLLASGVFLLLLSGCRSAWLLVAHREK